MRKTVYLSLGSNLGDREANLRQAITRLESLGDIKKVSSFYETEPVDFTDQPWFLNCAVELETDRMPRQLLHEILDIEREMGRTRTLSKGPRLIDIDILLFNDLVMDTPELAIPHLGMNQRKFVLQPLAEIAPEVRHPVLKKNVSEMLAELPKESPIVRRKTVD